MFEKIFDSPARIQSLHESPGGQLLEIFAKELTKEGYKVMTIRTGPTHEIFSKGLLCRSVSFLSFSRR